MTEVRTRQGWRTIASLVDEVSETVNDVVTSRTGEFFWYFSTSPPSYGLALDGSVKSRTTYAALWAFAQSSGNVAETDGVKVQGQFGPGDGSSTFTLPNLITGAEFIRSYTGTGTFGAWQADQLQSHSHTVPGGQNTVQRTVTGNDTAGVTSGESATTGTTGNFGTETRPRNVSLLPCIVF